MKAKLILFVAIFFIFNTVAIAQNQKQKVKNANQPSNANSQNNNTKTRGGNNAFPRDSLEIKSTKGNVKQPAAKAKVKQGGN